jgi:hypothetical protein
MLRCLRLAVFCGCCCWLTGCNIAKSSPSTSSASSAAASQQPPADVIQLTMAFIERPLGDPFLNKDVEEDGAARLCLWSSTDHHVDNIERQILLEENGLRIGQIVGTTPGKLLTLLGSEACVNPRNRILPRGEPAAIHLGPASQRSTFEVKAAGQSQSFTFEQARFCLDVIARPAKEGRVELEFTPKVEHRSSAIAVNVGADLMSYVRQVAPPQKSFPMLTWNVALKPGETLVIGADLEKPGTIGYRSFIENDVATPVQRVLVLRASGPVEEE